MLAARALRSGVRLARTAVAPHAASIFRPAVASWQETPFARFYSTELPEHIIVKMPSLSPTMETGGLSSWGVAIGDEIEAGDSLGEVETDKATMSFDSTEDGFVAKLLIDEGAIDIPVGQPVLVMVEEEGDIAAFADYVAEASDPAAAPVEEAAAPAPTPTSTPAAEQPKAAPVMEAPTGDRIFASPLAKRLAEAADVALQAVSPGTGPRGRVTKADVDAYIASGAGDAVPDVPAVSAVSQAGTTDAMYEDIPLTNVRKIIASRLLESKQTIPHYYLEVDCKMDKVMEMRARMNARGGDDYKLSVNDFIIKASALALADVPEVNSAWMDSFIRQYDTVDISVAVSTPNGLITPIVFDADAKGLRSISADVKDLAARAKDGALQPEEFQGGTFTISNLGMFGVKSFSAIINPPQSCILAVGGSRREVVVDDSAEAGFSEATVMSATISCDHRVIDGAVGAGWLKAFKGYMEDPETMLL